MPLVCMGALARRLLIYYDICMLEQEPATQKAYTSLANKYRPQTFEAVVGQDSVSKTLMNAVKSGRISHAYLFYGPRGCGKTTTARLLAKALNCTGGAADGPNPSPCGKCPQCLEIAASSDLDVLELDAASNTQVEKVREAIIETVSLAAGRDRYKIFILDEVHMLSTSSFNALLKTIEEPPQHVIFILATTELHKVPLTISSRCQTFRFKPIEEGQSASHLMDLAEAEGIDMEQGAAEIIAKNAGGALRDALTIMDRAIAFCGGKITEAAVGEMLGLMPKDLVQKAAVAVVNKDARQLHEVFDTIKKEGFDPLGLLKDLKNAFGNIFYFSIKAAPEPFAGAEALLKEHSAAYIAGLTRKISKVIDEVKFSDTPLLSAEVGLFTVMESSLDLDQFINRLSALEAALSSGDFASQTEKKTLNEPPAPQKAVQTPQNPIIKPQLKEELPAATAQQPVVSEPPTALSADAAQILWADFKKALSAKFPFLYESLLDAHTNITPDAWELSFSPDDDFSMDIMKRRMNDLKTIAKTVGAQSMEFIFKIDVSLHAKKEAAPVPKLKPVFTKPSTAHSAPQAQKYSAPKTHNAAAVKVKEASSPVAVLSAEEAFVEGDYSADADLPPKQQPADKAAVKAQTVQEQKESEHFSTEPTATAKRILKVIEGTLAEEY